jgi:GDP-L-fucose synthase
VDKHARIYVAGAHTTAGAALRRRLTAQGFFRLLGGDGTEPELRDSVDLDRFFQQERPEYVFVAAGRTAGIDGNQRYPADLMVDNLQIAAHLIPVAWQHGVRKLLYLASSCIYPTEAPQPLRPESLFSGALEPTSAPYAVAKLAGVVLCQAFRRQHDAPFITAISADAYGPGDDFSADHSHVAGALLCRIHDARQADAPFVEIWGTGRPLREFIYADDLADACMFAMMRYDDPAPLNLGTGVQTSVAELASVISDVVGYRGELRFDTSKPDGMPFKGLDSSPLHGMGWRPSVDLRTGLERTYEALLVARGAGVR